MRQFLIAAMLMLSGCSSICAGAKLPDGSILCSRDKPSRVEIIHENGVKEAFIVPGVKP